MRFAEHIDPVATLDAVHAVKRVAFADRLSAQTALDLADSGPCPTAKEYADAWERKLAGTPGRCDSPLLSQARSRGVADPDFGSRVHALSRDDDLPSGFSSRPGALRRVEPCGRAKPGEPPNPRGNPVRPAGETKAGYAAAVRDYAEVLSNIWREPAWEVCQRVGAGSRAIRAQCELVDKRLC